MSPFVLPAVFAGMGSVLGAAAVELSDRNVLLDRAGRPIGRHGPRRGWRPRVVASASSRLAVAVSAVAGASIGGIVAGLPGSLAGFAAGAIAPVTYRRRRAARAEEQVEGQLAESVDSIGAGLRAGLSLPQAIRFAADEVMPPLAGALREMVDGIDLGIPLAESLDRWANAHPSADVRLVASILRLHRRTGGDLPAVLDHLARTLRERRSAAREVRSLTAQARLSGAILGLLPVGFFLFLSATSRQDIAAAYHSPTGAAAIGLGLAMQAVAFLWIRRLLRVMP